MPEHERPLSIGTMVNGNFASPVNFIYAPDALAVDINRLLAAQHDMHFYGPEGTVIGNGVRVHTLNHPPFLTSEEEFQEAIFNPDYASRDRLAAENNLFARAMFQDAAAGKLDVLHFHHYHTQIPYAKLFPDVPIITTLHDPITPDHVRQIKEHGSPNSFYVAISESQKKAAPDLNYAGVVYNGIDTDIFVPSDKPKEDYLLWSARIVPDKGLEDAIEVAARTGRKLKVAGPRYPGKDSYYTNEIAPLFEKHKNTVEYLGVLTRQELITQLQGAAGFLMPIKWEEPFGLAVVEAMSCGAPVIAYSRGAMPEIIQDNKTGFLIEPNDLDSFTEAVRQLDTIDPATCRQHVLGKFSFQAMANSYAKMYKKVITMRYS